MMNLEQSLQKHEFVAVVKIIQEAINEISKGLSITKAKNTVIPIETYALHRKIHLWLYKAWRNCRSSNSTDAGFLESFPALPKFGTGLYVLIVEEMGWEMLLAECLINTHEEVLPFVLQDILATTISFQDSGFFTLLFDCLLPSFASKQSCHTNCSTLVQVLLEGLTSLCEYITDKNQQVHVIKKLIDFLFQGFQCHMKEHSNTCSVNQIEMERKRLVGSGGECKSDSVIHINSTIEDKHCSRPADNALTCWYTDSNVLYCLKVLMKLFTDQWKDICNWTTDNKNDIGQMDNAMWHPLHQWILKMCSVLGSIINATTFNASQDSRMWLFYNGLAVYVDANATTSESEWLCNQQKGFMSACIDINSLENEQIDMSGLSKTFMFTHGSLEEQLDDAIWRVKHNLEGSLDSLNWLLTTEELFDNPSWLQCIKDNVVKMGHKDHAIMMVDILCVQRQIIESSPECDNGGFDIIKELVIALFNDLSMPDQEEILKYAFSMSLMSAIDVTCDSVFFHPIQLQKDKKKLQNDLQVLFNKLVDSSLVSAFKRQVRNIKQLSLLCPYITLYKALQVGVQYGQTMTIVKILQEIPVLCFLCSNGTTIPLLCEILASIATELPSKQEENNVMKLVHMLLQRYRNAHLPGTSQPLLERTNLFTTCILPVMNLHGNKKPIPTKTALKLLKTTVNTVDLKNQTEKAFVLRYLIPIVLALCRLLNDCKVDWEEMGSNPMNVVELRSLVLVNLEESIHVIHSMFQSTPTGLIHPLEWLYDKLLTIGWTAVLYINPLLELLPTKRQYSIPKCVIEFCDLPTEYWTPCVNGSDYILDVVDCLFECCVISDTISSQMINALEKKSWSSVDISLKEQVIRKLSEVMTFITWSEMSRIVPLCTILIREIQLSLQDFSVHNKTPLSSLPDLPTNLNGIVVMSSILHQVFKLLVKSSIVIIGNVIKLYVSTIKQICHIFLTDPGLDKCLSGDVIARVFDDLCHVVCILPLEDTDPLFILALDIASMVSGRHVVSLKQSVAMAPKSVYTESLVQKLETRI